MLGFYLGSQYPLHRFEGARRHLPDGVVHPDDVVAGDFLDDFERLHALYEEAGGDFIYSACPFWGLPWVEASLGCTVIADYQAGSTHTESPPDFAGAESIPAFSADNPWVRKLLSFYPALVERSNGRYPVGVTLMRGVCDLLSALYGGETFLFRMMEASDEVAAVCEALTDYWIAFGKCLHEHVPLFHGGTGAFFYSLWSPGRTLWLQEDAAALLSPNLYERFIWPCDRKITEAFEHTVIHLHPAAFIPTDYLLETDIDVIELHVDVGGPSPQQLRDTHRRILAEKRLLVWGDFSEDDLLDTIEHLPHRALAVNMAVESVEQAHAVWERVGFAD